MGAPAFRKALGSAAAAAVLVAFVVLHVHGRGGSAGTALLGPGAAPAVGVLASRLQTDEAALAKYVQAEAKRDEKAKKHEAAEADTATRRAEVRRPSAMQQQERALDALQRSAEVQLSSAKERLTREQQEGLAIKEVMASARHQLTHARAEKDASAAATVVGAYEQEQKQRRRAEEARAAAAQRFLARQQQRLASRKRHIEQELARRAAARVPYSDAPPQLSRAERAFVARSVSSPLPPTKLNAAPREALSAVGWPGQGSETAPRAREAQPSEAPESNVQAVYGKAVHGSAPLALPGMEGRGQGAAAPARPKRGAAPAGAGMWPGESGLPIQRPNGGAAGEAGEAGDAHSSPLDAEDGGLAWPEPAGPAAGGDQDATGGGGAAADVADREGVDPLANDFDWPQVPPAAESRAAPARLAVVVVLRGADSAALSEREKGMVRAALAQESRRVPLGRVAVDYAYDVPDLPGQVELAAHLDLPRGVRCAEVARDLRAALDSGAFAAALAAFGLTGTSARLLGLSGCPSAHAPGAAAPPGGGPLVRSAEADAWRRGAGGGGGGASAGAGSVTDAADAADTARQVATQTAQQVASGVATAAAEQTAARLENELRALARRVAAATARRVATEVAGGVGGAAAGGGVARRAVGGHSALAALRTDDARRARLPLGP